MKTMKSLFYALAFTLFCFSSRPAAAQVEPVDKNHVAIGGYDVVAYLTDGVAAKGQAEITEEFKGVKYQFTSTVHRALFKKNPEKYLPVCDGYCAWGVAQEGVKFPVNPETFKVIDGKLYLFFNGDYNGAPFNTLTAWNKDEKNLMNQIQPNWKKLNK